jgi:hypothetical protein
MLLERRQAGPIPPVPSRKGFSSALWTFWPFVLASGVVVVFFADLIFGDLAWFNAPSFFQFFPWKVDRAYSAADVINLDAIRQFIPYKAYLKATWFGEGVFPLWNPFNLGGTPFFGSGLKSTLALTNFYYLFLDLATGLNAQIITQVFLSGVTMYFFSWKLTRDRLAASYDLKKFGYLWNRKPRPEDPGDLRVLKGSSWINFWVRLSISQRRWSPADLEGDYTAGFRCAAPALAENR